MDKGHEASAESSVIQVPKYRILWPKVCCNAHMPKTPVVMTVANAKLAKAFLIVMR